MTKEESSETVEKVAKEPIDTVFEEVHSAQPNPVDLIKDAKLAADRLEAANKQTAELLTRQEALQVEKTLGGRSSAGAPEDSAEKKAVAAARKSIEGSGFEDDLFPEEPDKQ